MGPKKKQHYVPQLHLRRFSFDGEHLHVYDKFNRKTFVTSTRDVAEENAFYNIPEQLITSDFEEIGIYPQMVEDILSRLEGKYQTALKQLLDTPQDGSLDDE